MTRHPRFRKATGLALASMLAFVACETDQASVFSPTGPPAFDFGVGPFPGATVPSGTAAVGASSVTLTLANLPALSGASYQFWIVGKDAQNFDTPTAASGAVLEFFLRDSTDAGGAVVTDPVTGDPIRVTDTTVVSATATNVYSGSDDPDVFAVEVVITTTADGSDPARPSNVAVMVSLEASAGATSPGPAQFLWRNTGAAGSGPMTFGNFSGVDGVNEVAPSDYVFRVGGSGQGGIRGDEVSVNLNELARPPVGFFYRGFLVAEDGTELMIDTLRAAWSADPSLRRVSMYNADTDNLLPGISGQDILTAQTRNCRNASNVTNCANSLDVPATDPYGVFRLFELRLEPKGATTSSTAVTAVGEVPDEVTT